MSRGPVDPAFLDAIVAIVADKALCVEAPKFQYDTRFPFAGLKAERERLRTMCPTQ